MSKMPSSTHNDAILVWDDQQQQQQKNLKKHPMCIKLKELEVFSFIKNASKEALNIVSKHLKASFLKRGLNISLEY